MSFLERYWWLQRLGGIALTVSCVGMIGWTLWQSRPSMRALWGNGIDRFIAQEIDRALAKNSVLMIVVALLCAIYGVGLISSSARGRDRYKRRLAALRGEADAIPIATGLALHPDDAPDVGVAPLVLQWAASMAMRVIAGPGAILGVAMLLVVPIVVLGVLIHTLQSGDLPSLMGDLVLSVMPVTVMLVYVTMAFVLVPRFIRSLPIDFGRPFGVSAGSEGIACVDVSGRWRFLRWDEMRLLEVTTNDTRTSRTFRVYGSQKSLEWSIPKAGPSYPPLDITSSEMVERSQSLLDLINARTGLVPRTFDKPRQQTSGKRGTAAAIGCMVGLVLATLGFIAGLIFVPVTSSQLLNVLLAATIIYCVVGSVGAVALNAIRKPPADEQSDSPQQLPEDVSVSYSLAFGSTVLSRFIIAVSGMILCLDLVPAILYVLGALELPSADAYPQILGIFGPIASLILLPIGVIGLSMLIGALWARVTFVTADVTGLTARRGRKTTFISWDQVERVGGEASGGTVTTYSVRGAFMDISWPGANARPTQAHKISGVLPISAYGLANLVAVRTGKALSISKRADRLGDYHDAIS